MNAPHGPTAEHLEQEHKIRLLQDLMIALDAEASLLLGEELSALERISRFTGSVQEKLRQYYASVFPKKCNNCETVYPTRDAYLQATRRLTNTSTIFDDIGLQEYRNCPCGSTLIVWTQDRRDGSEYGKIRRELFDRCLAKLVQISGKSEAEMRAKLRTIFSHLAS